MTRASRCESWFQRRVPRTIDTKRKTARTHPSAGRRPSAVLHEGQRSKRDRREAWPPATAQHDPHTLKGKKPHERPPEVGLVNVSTTGKETFAGLTGQGRTSRKGVLKRKSQATKPAGNEQKKCPIEDLSNPATEDAGAIQIALSQWRRSASNGMAMEWPENRRSAQQSITVM
jgi:hypothetical protein